MGRSRFGVSGSWQLDLYSVYLITSAFTSTIKFCKTQIIFVSYKHKLNLKAKLTISCRNTTYHFHTILYRIWIPCEMASSSWGCNLTNNSDSDELVHISTVLHTPKVFLFVVFWSLRRYYDSESRRQVGEHPARCVSLWMVCLHLVLHSSPAGGHARQIYGN